MPPSLCDVTEPDKKRRYHQARVTLSVKCHQDTTATPAGSTAKANTTPNFEVTTKACEHEHRARGRHRACSKKTSSSPWDVIEPVVWRRRRPAAARGCRRRPPADANTASTEPSGASRARRSLRREAAIATATATTHSSARVRGGNATGPGSSSSVAEQLRVPRYCCCCCCCGPPAREHREAQVLDGGESGDRVGVYVWLSSTPSAFLPLPAVLRV